MQDSTQNTKTDKYCRTAGKATIRQRNGMITKQNMTAGDNRIEVQHKAQQAKNEDRNVFLPE